MHVGFTMFEKIYVDGWQVTTRRSLLNRTPEFIAIPIEYGR